MTLLANAPDRPKKRKWEEAAELHRLPEHAALALAKQAAQPVDDNVLNARPDPIDFRDRYYQPSLVELRTRRSPRLLSATGFAVRQQGREGSCTGQALAAVIDMQNLTRWGDGANVPKRVSARMLYESARVFDEFAEDGLEGSSLRGALKGFFHRGVCDAAIAPYFDGDVTWHLTPDRAKDARRVGLGAYFRLRHELNDYHAAITEAGAIYCSAMVHKGWESAKVAANRGRIPLAKQRNGKPVLLGAHAFAIVGYDEEGFLVLNSWGEDWGGFDPRRPKAKGAKAGGAAAEEAEGPLPGVAHWSYEDWRDHVLDAWVLRLTAPTGRPSGFIGGYVSAKSGAGGATNSAPISTAVRDQKIRGHYIHVDDGVLVARPPYDNSEKTLRDTAAFIKANGDAPAGAERYDHLLFYAHGGLNDLDTGVERACVMTGVMKRLGIYPVFYLWRTGFNETLKDVLAGMLPQIAARTHGLGAIADPLIETIGRPLGRAVWRDMKLDAFRAANPSGGNRRIAAGGAWAGTSMMMRAAAERGKRPMKVHFVGHSAGAILIGELFDRMRKDAADLAPLIGSVQLLAPACTVQFLRDKLLPWTKGRPKDWMSVVNLTERAEASADPALLPYGKSLLHLVSNAFEEERQEPVAGMDAFWREHIAPARPNLSYELAGSPGALAGVRTHGGFDNDAAAMNRALSRVLGRKVDGKTGGFTRVELKSGDF